MHNQNNLKLYKSIISKEYLKIRESVKKLKTKIS